MWWYSAFVGCHDIEIDVRTNRKGSYKVVKINQRCFPDGESWMQQETIVTQVFNAMAREIREVVGRG